jgi:hypothetical protein
MTMRGIKALLMIPLAAALLLAGACTGNGYDDGSSADVVLQVVSFTTPPVTATTNTSGFCSTSTTLACTQAADCPGDEICNIGGCTLQVVDWNVALSNIPKNSLAVGPANDIAMVDVMITYGFAGAANPAPRAIGLGGVVIPTGGSSSITFPPVALQDLDPSLESSTGSLSMDFRGQTQEGTTITLTVGRELQIEACL